MLPATRCPRGTKQQQHPRAASISIGQVHLLLPKTSQATSPPPPISKRAKRIAKRARKVNNKTERIQVASKLFADQEAEAHIANQGIINVVAEVEEIGTTPHDEWFSDLRNNSPTLNKWYNHLVQPKRNKWLSHIETPEINNIKEETRRGVINESIPSAVVDTGATSNVGKYGCNLELTGEPSSKVFTTATGHKAKATKKGRMAH